MTKKSLNMEAVAFALNEHQEKRKYGTNYRLTVISHIELLILQNKN